MNIKRKIVLTSIAALLSLPLGTALADWANGYGPGAMRGMYPGAQQRMPMMGGPGMMRGMQQGGQQGMPMMGGMGRGGQGGMPMMGGPGMMRGMQQGGQQGMPMAGATPSGTADTAAPRQDATNTSNGSSMMEGMHQDNR